MNDKKGISPLIATVLIVGFTIVLAVLVITWISGTVNDTTSNADCNADASNICLSIVNDVEAEFLPIGEVMVTNSGASPFGARVLFSNDAGVTLLAYPAVDAVPNEVTAFNSWSTTGGQAIAGSVTKAKVIISATSTKGDGCTVECGNPIELVDPFQP